MAQKINLAMLNKKKEEIEKKDMHDVRGGRNCYGCADYQNTSSTDGFMQSIEDCACGSIFVVFGLAWG
ncbi:MAG: TIGR04149 family rSAM-modified RiPP [Candidatus Aminicenantes bacterium]|nr:TIGR04149 family rSAM-modified RiPP [Candidatus Aminicenantes bacterium]